MRMMQAGPPSPRATAALAMIAGIKQAAGQSMMAGRHIQRMKRMKPTQSRQFWTLAGMATAACVWMLITHPTAGSF